MDEAVTHNGGNDIRIVVDTTTKGVHYDDATEGIPEKDDWGVGTLRRVLVCGLDHEIAGYGGLIFASIVRDQVKVCIGDRGGDTRRERFEQAQDIVSAWRVATTGNHLWKRD